MDARANNRSSWGSQPDLWGAKLFGKKGLRPCGSVPIIHATGKTPRPHTDMKTTDITPLEAATIINQQFAVEDDTVKLVHVRATEIFDEEFGNPETQLDVDIIPFLFERSIKGESDRDSALSAAVCDIESLPFVQSLKEIGWVDSDIGRGRCYLLTLHNSRQLAYWF
jgi:hypothetical protein